MHTLVKTAVLMIALASVGMSSIAFAKGNGGGSSHSLQNSNGKNALDRDKGLERAGDRRNDKRLMDKQRKSRSHAQTLTK